MKKSGLFKFLVICLALAIITSSTLGTSATSNLNDSDFDSIFVDVTRFGAVKDDATVDNIDAINAAIDHLNSLGGGTLVFPTGTYYIKPSSSGESGARSINIGEKRDDYDKNKKIIISGNNSVIKVASDTEQYRSAVYLNTNGVVIENITFDANPYVSSAGTGTKYLPLAASVSTNDELKDPRKHRLISTEYMLENITMRNVQFIGYGTQSLYLKAQGALLDNCSFVFKTPDDLLDENKVDGCNYIDWYDVSSIFAVGKDITITNCSFTTDAKSYTGEKNFVPNTAIETHVSNLTIDNTVIDGYGCSILVNDITSRPIFNNITSVSNITINNCKLTPSVALKYPGQAEKSLGEAITLCPNRIDAEHPEYINEAGSIHDVKITNNYIVTEGKGVGIANKTTPFLISDVLIDSNTFKYVGLEDTYTGDPANGIPAVTSRNDMKHGGSCGVDGSSHCVSTNNFIISNNQFYDFPDTTIRFSRITSSEDAARHYNLHINNNYIYNCGYNYRAYSASTFWAFERIESLAVNDNHFVFNKEGHNPLNPLQLTDPRYSAPSYLDYMSYSGNTFEGYSDMSGYYKYNRDYTEDNFDFGYAKSGQLCAVKSSGITRLSRGDIFTDPETGVTYKCTDDVYLSSEPISATVTEIAKAKEALKVDDISNFKIGDRIHCRGRRAYIRNIVDLGDGSGILVATVTGRATSAQDPFISTAAVGDLVYLDTGFTATDTSGLKTNVEVY